MARACKLVRDFYLPHALAVFEPLAAAREIRAARQLWRIIEQKHRGEATVTRRELQCAARTKDLATAEQLDAALSFLIEPAGHLRELKPARPAGGGHAARRFAINPKAWR
jgi:hypothetical protein